MTDTRGTPRAAGWIIGRFVGSGHFNISPKHALEVAPGGARPPQRAAGRTDGDDRSVRARGAIGTAGRGDHVKFVGWNANGSHGSNGSNGARSSAARCNARCQIRRVISSSLGRPHAAGDRRQSGLIAVGRRNREDDRLIAARPTPAAGCIAALPGPRRPPYATVIRRARRWPGPPRRSTDEAPHTRATAASLRCGASGSRAGRATDRVR